MKRYLNGEEDISPSNVLMQKPDVILSEAGAFWVEEKFQETKAIVGLISQNFLDGLIRGFECL